MSQSLRFCLYIALLCGLLGSAAPAAAQEAPRGNSSSAVTNLPTKAVPYAVTPAAPNPFTRSTSFRLQVAAPQHVRIEIFNMLGQRIARLYDGPLPAGAARMFTFEADGLPSGIYLIRIHGEDFIASRQVTLLH